MQKMATIVALVVIAVAAYAVAAGRCGVMCPPVRMV
jgi:hypothetical protein